MLYGKADGTDTERR